MEKITVYQPDNSLKKGYLNTVREIFLEIKNNRWLTWQLFTRNFLSGYKQSAFGVLWLVFTPLVSLITFILLNKAGVFNIGDIQVPYPIYAILGMGFWTIFSGGVAASLISLSGVSGMLTKVNFSKKSVILSSVGSVIVTFGVQFALVIILMIVYRIVPSYAILFFPLLMMPLILLALSIGFLFSLINTFIQDVGKIINSCLGFLMFLTPILYAKPTSSSLVEILTRYNPVYYLVTAARDVILFGKIVEWRGYLYSVLVAVVLFIIGLFVFHFSETRISERI